MKAKIALHGLLLTLFALPAHAAEIQVNQSNKKFDKDQLSIKVGDVVAFLNGDTVKHNLTIITPDEESKDLGTEQPGASVKYIAEKAGVYDVRCNIHPAMKMKVKVD